MSIAVYPGTFDPITNGHVDIIERASRLFDSVVVAVASSQRKSPCFELKQRVELIQSVIEKNSKVQVVSFEGLLIDVAQSYGANILIRGLRGVADFEYEHQMAHMNAHLAPMIETVFLAARNDRSFVSSTLVREVALMGGRISGLVPPAVELALKNKFGCTPARSE